ncbi:hypothetical protein D3C85_1276850 [compost metagenome]
MCINTVMAATVTPIKISAFGILLMIRKLLHSKVPMATIIITPTKAAIGNLPITGAPTKIISRMVSEPIIADNLALAPAERLTKVCAIIGQPPIPKKKPFKIFAVP